MKKKCFKCERTKDLSLFYKHKAMSDGHLGKCKECTKTDATNHRNANIEKVRRYDRDRGKLPHRKAATARYTQKFRDEHPLAGPAHSMVARAIKVGEIERPDRCAKCNNKGKVYAHHEDYKKPLEVDWICQSCHKKLHRDKTI